MCQKLYEPVEWIIIRSICFDFSTLYLTHPHTSKIKWLFENMWLQNYKATRIMYQKGDILDCIRNRKSNELKMWISFLTLSMLMLAKQYIDSFLCSFMDGYCTPFIADLIVLWSGCLFDILSDLNFISYIVMQHTCHSYIYRSV